MSVCLWCLLLCINWLCNVHVEEVKSHIHFYAGVPGVLSVQPDSNYESDHKDYGGLILLFPFSFPILIVL